MPAYKQLGNRVSSLVDVKDLKKLRSSEKTYHPPLSFSLPNRMEKIAPQRCSPEIGERWGFNLGKFYSLIPIFQRIKHPHRERSGGTRSLERSSAGCSILDLP